MNRIHRNVWNARRNAYMVAAETTRSHGKSTTVQTASTVRSKLVATVLAAAAAQAIAAGPAPNALPTQGQVVAGQASITQSGNTLNITQGSDRAAIAWQRFDIGQQAAVNFVQPSSASVALNRVLGNDASQIYGSLRANGQVFLVNPNGVLFAPGAQVSTAGILASTRDIAVADFMAGKLLLSGNGTGTVVNQGALQASSGGYVVLVGAQVVNEGTITAPAGDVRLAAANTVELKIDGNSLTRLEVQRGTLDGLVRNGGAIRADGGRIWLTANALDALSKAVVNNEGLIEAHTVQNQAGKIVLMGDMAYGQALVGGTLDASAPQGGPGGSVETSAAKVTVRPGAVVTTRSSGGANGSWLIDPTDFTVAASGGDIDGATLGSNLAVGNVEIMSTSGASGTTGNLYVNDAVSWSANTLTLTALADIHINANLNGTGTAALALKYGMQQTTGASNPFGYFLGNTAVVSLPAGPNFSTLQGSNGTVQNYTVITALGTETSNTGTDLQGIGGSPATRAGLYALGADIDAASTATWNSGLGFNPIGQDPADSTVTFTGLFEGFGHTVSNLVVVRPLASNLGLFGTIDTAARVQNLHLVDVNITGNYYVGGLAGFNAGTVRQASVTGTVAGNIAGAGGLLGASTGTLQHAEATATVTGDNYVGGLIGASMGIVEDVRSAGSVIGRASGAFIGGLIGDSRGALDGATSTAVVNAPQSNTVGGLVGRSSGVITNSSASGNVTGHNLVGGLAGKTEQGGRIENSSASGNVSGHWYVGGLVGESVWLITSSSASGNVFGLNDADSVGGLVGTSTGGIDLSSASGMVEAPDGNGVGGLVGRIYASISESHASGAVTGIDSVGGLAGELYFGDVYGSHATGLVTGTGDRVGGLVGLFGFDGDKISNSYATGNVIGHAKVGGLVGHSALVMSSYATGTVSGTDDVGGLVGREKMGQSINNSQSSGTVTGTGTASGGLVGYAEANVIINIGTSTSTVNGRDKAGGLAGVLEAGSLLTSNSASGAVAGRTAVGGLVGYNSTNISGTAGTGNTASGTVTGTVESIGGIVGVNNAGAVLSNFTATNAVSAGAGVYSVGGMVGTNRGTVEDSSATAGVTSNGGVVGGLVGKNLDNGLVQRSSSSGVVQGAPDDVFTGGLVGFNQGSMPMILDSHSSATVTGGITVGGLVGSNDGTISGSYANGAVTATQSNAGGLVGLSQGSISNSQATGAVSGQAQTGGLVGSNEGGVTASTASGTVTGTNMVGGLIGANTGEVAQSTASGAVTGINQVGGFIGDHRSFSQTLSGSSVGNTTSSSVSGSGNGVGGFIGRVRAGVVEWINSTNTVTGTGNAAARVGGVVGENAGTLQDSEAHNIVSGGTTGTGGLVGQNNAAGQVQRSYSTGSVTGGVNVGGAVGLNAGGQISIVYATGAVSGSDAVGGLVGRLETGSSVANTYATGTVTGGTQAGGLVGAAVGGSISDSYAAGAVTGSGTDVGGFVGSGGATVSRSFFNTQTTGQARSIGTGSEVAAGKTTAEMQTASTFAGWSLATTGGQGLTWRLYEDQASPLLMNWLAPLTITSDGGTLQYVYDGSTHSNVAASLPYDDSAKPGHVLGSAHFKDAGPNVGTYTTLLTNYSDQQGWDITGSISGSLTITPATLTVSLQGGSKVYDGSTSFTLLPGMYTLTGFVAGQSATVTRTSGVLNSQRVPDANSVSTALVVDDFMAGAGTLLGNYILPTSASGTASVTPKPLGATAVSPERAYNGNTAVTVVLTPVGTVEGDTISLSGAGNFADRNAGTGKEVSVTGMALSGPDAANYSVPASLSTTGNVLAKAITLTLSAANKVYDGNTLATVTIAPVGLEAGDTLSASAASSNFADRNAATGKTVTAAGITLSGADAGNYSVAVSQSTTADITPRPITVGIAPAAKVYDGNTNASVVLAPQGLVEGDNVSASAASSTFADRNAGTGKTVTTTGITLGGTDAGNYSTGASATANTGEITPKPLGATAVSPERAYNGNTAVTVVLTPVGTVEGDTISLSGAGNFADRNAGTGKEVSVTGMALSGPDAANYSVPASLSTTGNVLAKAITLTLSAANKVYDGNTLATVTIAPVGLEAGDTLSASAASSNFADRNAATGKTVTAAGITLSGADAGNYSVAVSQSTTADITPRPITVGIAPAAKVYDGNTNASVVLAPQGLVEGDNVSASAASSNFADRNAGTGKTVTTTGIALSGTDAANYTTAGSATANTGEITPRDITVGVAVAAKAYDGSTTASATLSPTGLIEGDQVNAATSASFADANAGTAKAVTLGTITLSGAQAGNYRTTAPAGATADITPRSLTVLLPGPVSKTADGTTSATLEPTAYAITNLVAGEGVQLQAVTGSYDTAAPGSNKSVSFSISAADYLAASGTSLGNYLLFTGILSGPVGNILLSPPQIPPASLPPALPPVQASNLPPIQLPNLPNGVPLTSSLTDDSTLRGVNGGVATAQGLNPANASLVSSNTRENLLLRRAFSIVEGGIRLPPGVLGSDKDAP